MCNGNSFSGLSADVLAFCYESCSSSLKETSGDSTPFKDNITEVDTSCSGDGGIASAGLGSEVEQQFADSIISYELPNEGDLSRAPFTDTSTLEGEPGDVELGNFFFEDSAIDGTLPPVVLELQKKERKKELLSGKNLEKLEGIWKKVVF